MKIQLASDLHIEMRPNVLDALPGWRDPDADVLVLAGDICNLADLGELADVVNATAKWPHVIYIPGNHEYYGSSPEEVEKEVLLKWSYAKVGTFHIVMRPSFVEIENQRFACGTMWFSEGSVALLPEADTRRGEWKRGRRWQFSDFMHIKNLAPFCYEQNYAFTNMFAKSLLPSDVVVSHHLPSDTSTPPQFKTADSNCFFLSCQETVIKNLQPKLWVHGHTHSPCDYSIGSTRIVCNPLGYTRERKIEDYRPITLDVS